MSRFVLLYHACPPEYERPSHWDFMLEVGNSLHAWALRELPRAWKTAQLATAAIDPICPALAAGDDVVAEPLGHHRRVYLDYEGPVSGDRGQVRRIDSGTYTGEPKSPVVWRLQLAGRDLRGGIALQSDGGSTRWTLTCEAHG